MQRKRHTPSCRQITVIYLQHEVERELLVSFRQVVIFHGNEDGLTGLSGQQEGCSINGFKVPGVGSFQLSEIRQHILTNVKFLLPCLFVFSVEMLAFVSKCANMMLQA